MADADRVHIDWERFFYPIGADCYAPAGTDLDLCRDRILHDSARLFSDNSGGFEILWMPQSGGDYNRRFVESSELETTKLNTVVPKDYQQVIFIVSQEFSWSQLRVTRQAFVSILIHFKVFVPFLDLVHAFGRKTDENQRVCDSVYENISEAQGEKGNKILEVCYNIRYMEENERKRGSPWSLRQTGVYQRYDTLTERSVWILLQPSDYMHRRLSKPLNNSDSMTGIPLSPFYLHGIFLYASERNWTDWIEEVQHKIESLDEKACCSNVDENQAYDYQVIFADCQRLQVLRSTLLRYKSILDTQYQIAQVCDEIPQKLQLSEVVKSKQHFKSAVYLSKIDRHRGKVMILVWHASSIAALLSKILATRSELTFRETVKAMQTNLDNMQAVSLQSQRENEQLVALSERGQRDAGILKRLTQIATMYLPATLIATILSSNILSEPAFSTPLKVYLAATIPLLVGTFGALMWLERKST